MEESGFESLDESFIFAWKIRSSKMWTVFSFLTVAYWGSSSVLQVVPWALAWLAVKDLHSGGRKEFISMRIWWVPSFWWAVWWTARERGSSVVFPTLWLMKRVRQNWLWTHLQQIQEQNICLTVVGDSHLSPSVDWKISLGQELNL